MSDETKVENLRENKGSKKQGEVDDNSFHHWARGYHQRLGIPRFYNSTDGNDFVDNWIRRRVALQFPEE